MAIDIKDYSKTAAQRGWGAGWPSCGGAKAAGTAVVTADRSGTRFSVHKRIARLVDLLTDETERRGYLLKSGQCGGYNCRAIGGTSSPSNHSWGLACDFNWQTNPMKRPLTTDIPGWMVQLWNRYGFAWGGHYSGTPDAMHFEFMGTPAQADEMTALALAELTGSKPTPGGAVAERMEPAWPGGFTDDKGRPYDLFMFVKRNNVEIHQAWLAVQKLNTHVEKLLAEVAELRKQQS